MGTFNLLLLLSMVAFVMMSGASEPESSGFEDASTEKLFDEHLQRRLALAQFVDPKSVTYPNRFFPPTCTFDGIGIGRWTYEHENAADGFSIRAKPETAEWSPLSCRINDAFKLQNYSPETVFQCTAEHNIKSIITLGGSTSNYIIHDFSSWLEHDGSIPEDKVNDHTKLRGGPHLKQDAANARGLSLETILCKEANPKGFSQFLNDERFYENSLIIFNSGLWDMRANDIEKYERDVHELAEVFAQYKIDHPTSRVIWRASGTPNWDRLANQNDPRAHEKLLAGDNVAIYNLIATRAMDLNGIEVFDDSLMILGRPEETRTETDGLHPGTHMNNELMRVLLSVICS